jgi:hypothetical protein
MRNAPERAKFLLKKAKAVGAPIALMAADFLPYKQQPTGSVGPQ